jgi:MFS superfamily sulfate permease-like transporter
MLQIKSNSFIQFSPASFSSSSTVSKAQLSASAVLSSLSSVLAAVASWLNRLNRQTAPINIVASVDALDRPKVYQIFGKLFCGSVNQFGNYFNYLTDPQQVVLDFSHAQICDSSATQAIEQVMIRYHQLNKSVNLVGLDYSSHAVVRQSGIGIHSASFPRMSATAIPETLVWDRNDRAGEPLEELSEKV